MASSDMNLLLEMGFEKERAEIALKKSGGLQGALEWLEANQDKPLDEIKGSDSGEGVESDEPPALQPGEEARSLICNVCQKKFRSHGQAEFHASKTEHVDFSESTEVIPELTAEQKKEKLEELKRRAAERKAGQSEKDKEEQKRNEAIRRKANRDTQDIKEDLQRKEQLKHAAQRRKEKDEEVAAKERIRAKIAADKEERRLKAEAEKAKREGRAPAIPVVEQPAAPPSTPKPASAYTETRLRLQTPKGNVQKTFPVDTTLFEVAVAVGQESGFEVQSFSQNFPRKVFDSTDFGKTLKEAGLVPSAALILK
ncbi:hypothetical protein L228DRAFT_244579 [Xylona heveae TC161]|uniref:UBX domain protein n=1 Tax=Xylona heveae (strain CBS 132557 / TC161) TaxID=1328760 RepID=A0A165J3V7_XYLHT|nr:hypothetical protein L228DRAFT_244579 [Xylona heveae TC161]KZF25693.1 hypothetical protein L228DRAFT_244579 [Xylona heveae TC161]